MKNVKTTDGQKPKGVFWRKVTENEPISKHTTLGIGGPAKYFIEVKDASSLMKAVSECLKYNIRYVVFGKGSNILASDNGFDGLLIVNKLIYAKNNKGIFKVGAGMVLLDFINYVIDKGYSGLEKMSGIPGTVGGAVYGNAGAYGQAISDHITKVTVFDGKRKRVLSKKLCKFGYRDSVFKKSKYVIIEAEFFFDKGEREFLKKVSLDTIQLRAQKYSPGIKCPGSYFKNILASDLKPAVLKQIPEDKITFGKIASGYLMESVGAKGAQKGDIKIADNHGNLIVNLGNGTAKDFLGLTKVYAAKVKKKFGIELEPEVQMLGFEKNAD